MISPMNSTARLIIIFRHEALEWYGRYTSFLKDAIDGTSAATATEDNSPVMNDIASGILVGPHDKSIQRLCLFFVTVLLLYVYSIRLRVTNLETIILDMQSRMLEIENRCMLGT